MHKALLVILFCALRFTAAAQHATDTFKLYFDLGVATLNAKTEKRIDLLIYNDKILTGSSVMIVGYADYLGSNGFNKNLSMKRAGHVKDYLVKYGINPEDIKLCVGEGEVNRAESGSDGFPTDRRVDIVINNTVKKKIPPQVPPKGGKPKKDTVRRAVVTNLNEITKLKAGTTFQLNSVYFPADRHVIKPESYKTLEKLFVALRDNPRIKISIEGHVCCIKDAPDALDADTNEPSLSVNRAKAIYNYLVEKGIDAERLKYAGFGKRHPIVYYEATEEDAEKNRRVEIRITEN